LARYAKNGHGEYLEISRVLDRKEAYR